MKLWIIGLVILALGAPASSAFAQAGPGKNGPALPGSQAKLAEAREKLIADQDKLDEMMKHRQELFEKSPEYIAAQKAFDDAQAADKDARAKVLAELAKQPGYQSAKTRADAADAAAKNGGPDLAQAALTADGVVSKLENAALSSDDNVKTADAALKKAREAVQKLKDDNDMKIKYDDHMVAQRDDIKKDQETVAAWEARVATLSAKPARKKK
ncbi:MAG TPA: hypothetical protein VH253_06900 [Phycisphaerae bacterium]|nr:hypothetical protein [Phycisphaerae bacterium]